MPNLLVVAENEKEYERLMQCISDEAGRKYLGILRVETLEEAQSILEKADLILTKSPRILDADRPEGGKNDPVTGESSYSEGNSASVTYTGGREVADAVREMIQYNYKSDDSTREYAKKVHLSLTYLCRIFKRETGQSIGEYINENRMNEASHLLIIGNRPIRQIALQVGFSNFSYFSKRFREYFHMTPRQYRKNHRELNIPKGSEKCENSETQSWQIS